MRAWDVVQCNKYELGVVCVAVSIIQYLKEQVGCGGWNMSGCRIIE
jgi:hypothetical protein